MLINDVMTITPGPGVYELGVIGDDDYLVKQVVIDTTNADVPLFVDGFCGSCTTPSDELQVIVKSSAQSPIGVTFRHLSQNVNAIDRVVCPGNVDLFKAADGAVRWYARVEVGWTNGED